MVIWYVVFFLLLPASSSSDLQSGQVMNMDTILGLIKDLESTKPDSSAQEIAQILVSPLSNPSMFPSAEKAALTHALLSHKVVALKDEEWQEQGVVLAPDGSTVAVKPLLDALLSGWKVDCKSKNLQEKDHQERGNNARHPTSLAMSLALGFADSELTLEAALDVPHGCWDSVSTPKTFKLPRAPSRHDITLAYINGALDGTLLREMVNETQKMSSLLQSYYWGRPARSAFRRQNFQDVLKEGQLIDEIRKGIHCYRNHTKHHNVHPITEEQINSIASIAAKHFEEQYLDCPAVIPRCMWEAEPYKGTPTLLKPPLPHVYIHHTYEPSRPCVSFQECAADMRSMQRFHQEDRGWDDIGYSFVAGSDGYLYEGRGWHQVGAHTKGHNSVGYGISFIGNFTSSVPDTRILKLVRDGFLKWALRSGYILPNYTIQGHRQVVNTSCPGDALFREITSWEHFTKESQE